MKLFSKIARGATKLFNKYKADPHLFRKISNTARDVDTVVNKVGNFLTPYATAYHPALGAGIQSFVQGTNQVRNGLEKAIEGHRKNENERNKIIGI
jgi:hypothetical protein